MTPKDEPEDAVQIVVAHTFSAFLENDRHEALTSKQHKLKAAIQQASDKLAVFPTNTADTSWYDSLPRGVKRLLRELLKKRKVLRMWKCNDYDWLREYPCAVLGTKGSAG